MSKTQKPEPKGMSKLRKRIHQSLGVAFGGHLIRDYEAKPVKLKRNIKKSQSNEIQNEIRHRIKFIVFVLNNFKQMQQFSHTKGTNGRRSMQTQYRSSFENRGVSLRAIDILIGKLNSDLVQSPLDREQVNPYKDSAIISNVKFQIATSIDELKVLDSIPGLNFQKYLYLLKECIIK